MPDTPSAGSLILRPLHSALPTEFVSFLLSDLRGKSSTNTVREKLIQHTDHISDEVSYCYSLHVGAVIICIAIRLGRCVM